MELQYVKQIRGHFRNIHLLYKFCFIIITDNVKQRAVRKLQGMEYKLAIMGLADSCHHMSASALDFVLVAQ